ncbi:MAG TPA: glycosyltransferase family 9 protein [Caulobacteraceae bacterium]|nr:glycosyltransferase family 9 protein [Caulobacteraceae bacterium]
MATKPFPILFITPTDVGGAIASSGLLKRLVEEVPQAEFTIVADEAVAPLYAQAPRLERLVMAEETEGRVAKFGLWQKLRGRRWGLIVDLRGAGISKYMSRARRAEYQPNGDYLHPVLQAAKVLGLEDDPPEPHLYVNDETEAWADRYLGEGGPVVVIAPEAEWSGRVWPTERFALVANKLFAADGPLPEGRLIVLADHDEGEAAELARFSGIRPRVIGRPGELNMMQAYAVLKRARLFLGNDNLWMHLAAAAGAPTIGLFGPSDEDVSRPWGPHAKVVRGSRPFSSYIAIDPGLNQAINHMMDLRTEPVFEACVEVLETTKDSHG